MSNSPSDQEGLGSFRPHTEDDLQIDIFRDLDTGLIEIFQRNQYERFLRGIPPEQHQERLAMLQLVIHNRARPEYVRVIWLWNFIPFPLIQYKRLWNDVNVTQLLTQFALTAFNVATRLFRFSMFLIGSSFYLQRTMNVMFMFAHELTFSKNFFGDILTFILRDHSDIFSRRSVIENRGVKYLIAMTYNYNQVPFWDYFIGLIYNSMVIQVNSRCEKQPDNQYVCTPNTGSLIFKFQTVFEHNFPNVNTDVYVVFAYLAYALVGNFVCMNVFYLYSINVVKSLFKFNTFLSGIGSLLWRGTAESVF